MNSERITNLDHPDWPALWRIYETSFPAGERRTLEGQKAVIGEPRYFFELWRNDENDLVGFTGAWICERFRFLEHIAIDAEQRNGGYGKKIMTEWTHRPGPVVLLEIDPLTDEISHRRHGFYQRLGYQDNDLKHSHPSYQDGTGEVPLLLMSHPRSIDRELYDEFVRCQNEEMLAHLRMP